GITGAAGAAPGLVVGQVRAGTGVIGLLGFPGHQAVLYVDLPTAGAGAVHPMGGSHDPVVLPAGPVPVFPVPVFVADLTMVIGKFGWLLSVIPQAVQKVAHGVAPRGLLTLILLAAPAAVFTLAKAW